jgi:hypothetical protein
MIFPVQVSQFVNAGFSLFPIRLFYPTVLSRSPVQKSNRSPIYGWLLGHWSVRVLMFQAATTAGVPPLRLSFTGTLRVIRRAIPKFQHLQPEELPLFSIG